MGHGKETPRQKMIGMMYLVLTAMLALNVSSTVLNAFILVDEGLTQTAKSFTVKNDRLYTQIDNAYTVNPRKVGPWKDMTDEIRKRTQEIYNYIQDLKVQTVLAAEKKEDTPALIDGREINAKEISGKGDTNISGRLFLGANHDGEAFTLKKRIIDYREFMLSHLDVNIAEQLVTSINNILNTDPPPPTKEGQHTWESYRFDHQPLVSVFPQLTKMQLDILNVEAEVVNYLLSRVGADDFKVNRLEAVVIPSSNFVIEGTDFTADIFLAASDTTQVPRIFVGQYEKFVSDQGIEDYRMVGSFIEIPVKGGKGIYTSKGTRRGKNPWSGLIEVTAPDGSKLRRPFKHEYEVAQPPVVISPIKMNVFYRGVDNPVEISIPGFSNDKIHATIDGGGSIRPSGDGFIVNPGAANNCNITVFADVDGTRRNMGSRPFRIRNVPDPTASVRGITGRTVTKGELMASLALEARMPVGFDFDMSFTITGFTVMATVGGFARSAVATNQLITEDQKRIFDQLRSGQSVSITDIKAVGPDGSTRDLNDIVIKIR